MEKTAMMQMLEWVRKTFPMDLDTPRMIEEKIESLLKVEKDRLFHSFYAGGGVEDNEEYYEAFEQYYNETYGNDK
jgi:hypothetical protein